MLLFCCISDAALPRIRANGLRADEATACSADFEAARASCTGALLVVASDEASGGAPATDVPPAAILNLDPYRAPKPVAAAGGYVMRPGSSGPELLMIFRRGVWDLPKGKVDAGETVDQCALREVREEVGLGRLVLHRPLGTTVHGYPERNRYCVKTTYWFLMETPETTFSPQTEEDIEAVEWFAWDEAMRRIGFPSLRDHMAASEDALRGEAWLSWPSPGR